MEFNKEFTFRLARKLAGFFVAVPLAFVLRNYWALVAGIVVSTVVSVILSFFVHPYRPRLALSAGRDLMTFSKWIMFNIVLRVIHERFAYFVIGKLAGARPLGLFTMGYEISNFPTTELVAPINRAVYPGYAKFSKDPALLRESYLNVISLIALLALPAAAGIAALAGLIVPVFLGDDWGQAIPLMRLLGAYGAFMSLQSNVYSAFVALGRPNVMTWLALIRLAVMIPLVGALTYHHGAIGASWAYAISGGLLLVANYAWMFRTLGLPLGGFLEKMWRQPLASVVMYFAVDRLVDSLVSTELPESLQLALGVSTGIVVYVGLVFGLWVLVGRPAGAESAALKQVTASFRARFGRKKGPGRGPGPDVP